MILFISHYGGRTGAPIVLLHLLNWLRSNTRHEMRVLVRGDGPLVESFRAVAETVVIEPAPPTNRLGRLVHRLRNRINPISRTPLPASWEHTPIDLIYSNTITNGALVSGLAKPGVPVITHVHEMSYWIERSGTDNWQRVVNQTSRYISVSRAVKDNLTSKFKVPAQLVDVVHGFILNPASIMDKRSRVRTEFGIPDDAFIIGGSGNESWRKGRDLFVQLAANVHRMLPSANIHFLWVGYTGDADDQQRLIHDSTLAGVGDKVHWTGEVSDPDRYFSEFDLFAMVSREDPFPLVCLETALHGKPILCFADAGGVPELVEEDAGFVVPYLDLHTMARRVVELVENPALTARFGKKARNKVLERHTVDQAGPIILDIIERELKRAKQS
jgi:glycosyltransferase involved in cell wall biosynthesis